MRLLIQDLLDMDVIEEAEGKVFLSHLFLVPNKDSDKERVILDLSHSNKRIQTHKFTMVTVSQVHLYLQQGAWLAPLDL